MDSAEQRDPEIIDNIEDGGRFDSDGAGISLPSAEEIKTEINVRRKPVPYKAIALAVVCLLAIVIGLSVGLSGNANASSASSVSAGDSGSVATGGDVATGGGNEGDEEGGDNEGGDNEGDGYDGTGSLDRYTQAYNLLKGISSPDAIRSQGTPQYLACNWIANGDQRQIDIPSNTTVEGSHVFVQRYVLALLYYSMGGDKWNSFLTNRFLSSEDECNWNIGMRADDTIYELGTDCDVDSITRLFLRKFLHLPSASYCNRSANIVS